MWKARQPFPKKLIFNQLFKIQYFVHENSLTCPSPQSEETSKVVLRRVLIHQTQAPAVCRCEPFTLNSKNHYCLFLAMSKKEYFISSNKTESQTILLHLSKIKGSPLQRSISHVLQRGLASLKVSANSQTNPCTILLHTPAIAAACVISSSMTLEIASSSRTGQRAEKRVSVKRSGQRRTTQN